MTGAEGDRGVLAAAARISDAYASLSGAMRRVADQHLIHYPVLATDPKLPGPALPEAGAVQRRTVQLLTAAGGGDLYDAAERLAGWAGPALKTAALTRRLEEWLPDTTELAGPVALTRRLVCDAAGLATTPWSIHAASVAVLDRFAPTAMALADDAELIDERALREADAVWGGDDIVFEALVEVCGFERVFGRLAVRRNRLSLSKAALLDLGRSATSHEVAQRTGLAAADAALAFTTCDSIVRTGYGRWAAHNDPRFVAFARTAAELTDHAGLIDEPRLVEAASRHGWDDTLDAFMAYAGFVLLNGQLAASDTNRAKVMAALVDHGAATIEEIAEASGLSTTVVAATARRLEGVRTQAGLCWITDDPPTLPALARAHSDDVGLVDIDSLAAAAAAHGYETSVEQLAEHCGLVVVFGRCALKASTAAMVKAALLELGRPATVAELKTLTGRSPKAVSHAVVETPSIVQVAPKCWTVDTDGALAEFAAAAADRCDDVGLVDEVGLQAFAAERGWSHRYDALIERCAMVRVSNRLAVSETVRAAVKAALSDFGRPATSREVALVVEMTAGRVAATLQSIASVTRIGPSMWVTDELADGAFVRFGAALWLCSDDVGLIDDTRLSQIANEQQWQIPVDDLVAMCRLPRLHGSLAMADTAAAAAKAALLELQRPATLNELAAITGRSYNNIRNALEGCESVQRVSAATYGHSGLIAVRDPQPAPHRAANPPADRLRRSR